MQQASGLYQNKKNNVQKLSQKYIVVHFLTQREIYTQFTQSYYYYIFYVQEENKIPKYGAVPVCNKQI